MYLEYRDTLYMYKYRRQIFSVSMLFCTLIQFLYHNIIWIVIKKFQEFLIPYFCNVL